MSTNVDRNLANNSDAAVTVVGDYDGDGVSNPFDLDDDNDGMSDADEIIAGTLPRDETSFFWVRITGDSADTVRRLTFLSNMGHTYHVQSSTNIFTGPWVNVRTNISGTNGLINILRTNPLDRVYYRIGVETP